VLPQKLANLVSDLLAMGFKREVASVVQIKVDVLVSKRGVLISIPREDMVLKPHRYDVRLGRHMTAAAPNACRNSRRGRCST
jgi:hypothetical protein